MSEAAGTTHSFGCNLCEALCGLRVPVDGRAIGPIRGDPDDLLSRGHVCPKGPALRELFHDPDRLRTPLRRNARGQLEPVGWEQALDEIAARLRAIQSEHGRDAVALYAGNPTVHSHRATLGVALLTLALGTRSFFNPNSQDSNPRLFACLQSYGSALSMPVPDVDRTDLLVLLGTNPAASGGSQMVLGDPRHRLGAIRERGGRIVLFDPRRSESAAWCDQHHFIRPGGDAALLLAILHVVYAKGWVDAAHVDSIAVGREALGAVAARYSPERVGPAIGVAPEVIRELAQALATTPRAAVHARVGACQNEFGPLANWLVEAVNLVTGHFDREGGVLFPRPAADLAPLQRLLFRGRWARWRSRVRGLPELLGAIPSSAMAEEIETEGKGRIRAMVVFAGDPVLTTPNGPRLAAALERLECLVAVDFYLNETARRAHFVLPPLHLFESGNYDLVLLGFTARNFARYSPPIVERAPGSLDDFEILGELALRTRLPRPSWLRRFLSRRLRDLPERILDLLLRLGPYRLRLAALRAAPHGLDLGPLTPSHGAHVYLPDKKARLAPEVMLGDLPRLDRWLEERASSLVLIGRRHLRSNNSWMHNLPSLTKGPDRSQLVIHPKDAAARGLGDGDPARIRSRTGAVVTRVRVSDEVMPGVVSLPHGFGHAARGALRVAGALPGVNANALTDEALIEPLVGTSILSGVPVEVEAIPGDLTDK